MQTTQPHHPCLPHLPTSRTAYVRALFLPSALLLVVAVSGGCTTSDGTPAGATGGAKGTGGAGTTGGSSGTSTGGSSASGGATGSGGVTGSGGSSASGGSSGTGGASASGGSPATGGSSATGGASSSTGGRNGNGGAASGGRGNATGGATGTGGSAPGDGGVSERPPVSSSATATFGTGAIMGMAVFTQTGADVTVKVDLTGCPAGAHQIFIGSGFSCDSTATEGGIWDGQRGPIGSNGQITCTGGGTATLTYTRPGTNAATRWTVADHAMATDVTNHVVVISSANDINTRQGCANFF